MKIKVFAKSIVFDPIVFDPLESTRIPQMATIVYCNQCCTEPKLEDSTMCRKCFDLLCVNCHLATRNDGHRLCLHCYQNQSCKNCQIRPRNDGHRLCLPCYQNRLCEKCGLKPGSGGHSLCKDCYAQRTVKK